MQQWSLLVGLLFIMLQLSFKSISYLVFSDKELKK